MWELKFKRKPKKLTPVVELSSTMYADKPMGDNVGAGWSSYKVHQQVQLDPLGSAAKYMSHQFNAYCSELGVQCTVTMDPSDFKQLFIFKVVGDRDVRIEYDGKVRILGPGEWCRLKSSDSPYYDGYSKQEIPRITALPHGNV
jgi:hypothetical protein